MFSVVEPGLKTIFFSEFNFFLYATGLDSLALGYFMRFCTTADVWVCDILQMT